MTKEELKKEAEELIQRFEIANSMNCYMQLTPDRKQIGEMLVMIAEPREKRIAELEQIINDMQNAECTSCTTLGGMQIKIAELEKQLEELPDKWCRNKDDYCPHLAKFEKENAELKERAKSIIEDLKALYFSPVVTKDDLKRQDKILADAENFLKESEVEK